MNSDEFDVGHCHPLGLQEQVAEILVAATSVDQHANISIDRLDDSEADLGPAIVQNALQMLHQHVSQLLERDQPLPFELLDPLLGVVLEHGPGVAVIPQSLQAFFQQVGFEDAPIQLKQPVQLPALFRGQVLPATQQQPLLPLDQVALLLALAEKLPARRTSSMASLACCRM